MPRSGDITRATLDLVASESARLERLTQKIARETGRHRGRSRLRPQHVTRAAVRRLLVDPDLIVAVTADITEGRHELPGH
ncbi:hypothetical protein [Pseudonocardia sp. ICBG601]|uniref:hypothetical protein n=1 Tax=Pseudonocardia sp. ICBG601 TaxID=2846759 RepID=UPI001CF705DD|nr:hypothetical protein [Pseudonocardia sp. ICBG601]